MMIPTTIPGTQDQILVEIQEAPAVPDQILATLVVQARVADRRMAGQARVADLGIQEILGIRADQTIVIPIRVTPMTIRLTMLNQILRPTRQKIWMKAILSRPSSQIMLMKTLRQTLLTRLKLLIS